MPELAAAAFVEARLTAGCVAFFLSDFVNGYDIHEMLGTKMRALFQIRRGRDLFDLDWALTLANPPVDPAAIIESFEHYLRQEGNARVRRTTPAKLENM